ncbi:unnamed protein product, partial [Vitis vinifera]
MALDLWVVHWGVTMHEGPISICTKALDIFLQTLLFYQSLEFKGDKKISMSTATPPKTCPSQLVVLNKAFKLVNSHTTPPPPPHPPLFCLF